MPSNPDFKDPFKLFNDEGVEYLVAGQPAGCHPSESTGFGFGSSEQTEANSAQKRQRPYCKTPNIIAPHTLTQHDFYSNQWLRGVSKNFSISTPWEPTVSTFVFL